MLHLRRKKKKMATAFGRLEAEVRQKTPPLISAPPLPPRHTHTPTRATKAKQTLRALQTWTAPSTFMSQRRPHRSGSSSAKTSAYPPIWPLGSGRNASDIL